MNELVKEFLAILDYTEVSDSGRVFRPTYITSCRVAQMERLAPVLNKMRELVNE